jgi:adenine-specific DNA-methyltransferase
MSNRLKAKLRKQEPAESLEEELDQDYEALDETAEEWAEDAPPAPLSDSDRAAIEQETADLDAFASLATSIEHNAKGRSLLKALDIAFGKAVQLGGAQKAIIFRSAPPCAPP